jgi:hypothetical protein
VTGAYVTVKTMTMQGPRIVGLFAGAPWPADAPEDSTKHHLSVKLIAEVPEPESPAEPEPVKVPAKAPARAAAKDDS